MIQSPPTPLSIAFFALFALLWFNVSSTAPAQTPPTNAFATIIRPLFQERCFACHGALKQEASLRLDTVTSILQGSDNGPIVDSAHPDNSPLLERLTTTDLTTRMPPEGHPLSSSQLESIRSWIKSKPTPPVNDHPDPSPSEHWAYKRIARPTLPTSIIHNCSNPIDQLILAQLEKHSLTPRPLADPATRLRRLHLDLVGLPPSPELLQSFLDNPTQLAYEKVALQLLSSPQYGERWGRHWMDVWRYADWFGRRYVPDVWNSAPQIWRWRDWIIHSLNTDKGYDQMVREMLAADEVTPNSPADTVATGFLIRNWYALNPNDWMRSNVEHTAKAFLGLTFQCAHCHDHKYDPISQEDYFRFRAFFEPLAIRQDRVNGEPDPGPFQEYEYSALRKVQRLGMVSTFDKSPEAPTWFYTHGDERNRLTNRDPIQPGVPDFLSTFFTPPTPQSLPPPAYYPGLLPEIRQTLKDSLETKAIFARKALAEAHNESNKLQSSSAYQIALDQLQTAEQQLALNNQSTDAPTSFPPLAGRNSLLLNATSGRRMIYRSLPEITNELSSAVISFDVAVLSKAHFNFQLTRDNTQGLTATFVGFENGEIRAYQPSSFNEFSIAKIENHQEPSKFHVELTISIPTDQCLLTIVSLDKQTPIAKDVPIALNHWNPFQDLTKGILFDARPGALAAIDNIRIDAITQNANPNPTLLEIDFESPQFKSESDVTTYPHWQSLSFSSPPADSKIVASIPTPAALGQSHHLAQSKRIASLPQLVIQSAEAQVEAVQAELEALAATIQADDAKFFPDPSVLPLSSASELASRATTLQRIAQWKLSQAATLTAEVDVAKAESKPTSDSQREKEIQTALAQWNAARTNNEKVRERVDDKASDNYQPLTRTYPTTSTGRRQALAEWITHRDNPLSARVAVNHIWTRHFHKPLVPTMFDFGRNAPLPLQRELLDWLAAELIESNWSMKHIHFLIVTSEAFQRLSSNGSPSAAHESAIALDPDNHLYWKMNTGRMEAEIIRDTVLHISGSLDQQLGGQELENNLSFTTYRRSVYYSCQPEEDGKSPLGQLFDGPDPTDCYRRTRTVIPQQALALTNSPLIHEAAIKLQSHMKKTLTDIHDPEAFVPAAYRSILSRDPTAEETKLCTNFLSPPDTQPTIETLQQQQISLLRVLFNHNDFITIR
jgi:mono/diheme cytochrome c family protein